LPRDADQQYQVGEPVERHELQPGDLVFFGSSPSDITHVGLYAGDGNFVHASSGRGVVTSKLFAGWYLDHYQGARRVLQESPSSLQVLTPEDKAEVSR
jgi:cell wall-associated NlpC family hydrolase